MKNKHESTTTELLTPEMARNADADELLRPARPNSRETDVFNFHYRGDDGIYSVEVDAAEAREMFATPGYYFAGRILTPPAKKAA